MKRLPDTEFEIMEIIWSFNDRITSSDIYAAMPEKKWKPPTIISFLKRLEEKGFVTSEKTGKERYYTATVSRRSYLEFETKLFFDKYHKKSLTSFMNALFQSDTLSEDEIIKLKRMLDDLTKE